MIVAVCTDDNGGILFNSRRISRDEAVLKDLERIAEDKPIRINEFSVPLFKGTNIKYYEGEDFLENAAPDDICFAENIPASRFIDKTDMLILYCWNRRYPSDFKFDADLSHYRLIKSYDLSGKSHDKITVKVYGKINE